MRQTRVVRLGLVLSLIAGGMTLASVGGPRARAAGPLVTDSLKALDDLVATANCKDLDAVPAPSTSPSPDPSPSASGSPQPSPSGAPASPHLPYRLCDDGVPAGTGGANGIPVPVAYHPDANGDDFTGLPAPASADEITAADGKWDLKPDASGDRVTLDVDVTLPPVARPPTKGYPVLVFMHGCCGGSKASWEATNVDAAKESWHHSNAYFASRGYVVINYTARGFRNSNDEGSSGTTQLDSRRFEINDYQYLVGLMADDDAAKRAAGETPIFNINPQKVGAVGGSYGGGFSWLALTDPKWKSPAAGIPIKLGAVVPKYGWTDLVESLVPSGHYLDRDHKTGKTSIAPTDVETALSGHPIGVEKQSIVSGLYATGNLASGNHTTFPQWMHTTFARIQQGEPYDGDTAVEDTFKQFLEDRSAYFQQGYWKAVGKGLRVPIYSATTWTDPLFPTMEHMRFYNKLTKIAPTYPITTYIGDYQHFVQNKAKEWDDICQTDDHVCAFADYVKPNGGFNLNKAPSRIRQGIDSKISKFLDYYLRGVGKKKPKNDITATTTICPDNADPEHGFPADEPGIEYHAPTWRALAPKVEEFAWTGGGAATTMSSSAATDGHADQDPVATNGHEECYTASQNNPGLGIVQYVSDPLDHAFTLMGIPWIDLDYTTMGTDYWITVRLYDQTADGSLLFVTRGICKVNTAADDKVDCKSFDLWGNGWSFAKGDKVVLEVSQSDTPTFRKDNVPSTISFTAAKVHLPVTSESLRHDFRD